MLVQVETFVFASKLWSLTLSITTPIVHSIARQYVYRHDSGSLDSLACVAGKSFAPLTTVPGGSLQFEIVSNVFLSPLRNIPGPFLAKVTPKWLIFVDLAGYRTLTLHKLHQRYGSAVRIGPQEVSFSNPEMVKEIYGQQTVFMKAPIYDNFSSPPIGIFSMRGKAQHSERRRLLSHAFSQVNLSETEPLIEQQIQKLVRRVEANLSKPLDMLELFRMTAFDIVGRVFSWHQLSSRVLTICELGELFLGQSFGGLDSDRPPQFLVDMDNAFIIGSLERSFPWMCAILRFLHVPAVENFLASRVRLSGVGAPSPIKSVRCTDLTLHRSTGSGRSRLMLPNTAETRGGKIF